MNEVSSGGVGPMGPFAGPAVARRPSPSRRMLSAEHCPSLSTCRPALFHNMVQLATWAAALLSLAIVVQGEPGRPPDAMHAMAALHHALIAATARMHPGMATDACPLPTVIFLSSLQGQPAGM